MPSLRIYTKPSLRQILTDQNKEELNVLLTQTVSNSLGIEFDEVEVNWMVTDFEHQTIALSVDVEFSVGNWGVMKKINEDQIWHLGNHVKIALQNFHDPPWGDEKVGVWVKPIPSGYFVTT